MGNRGAFAKAFSEHRKNGGTMTRKEFGEEFKKKNKNKEAEVEDPGHNMDETKALGF